MVARWHGWSGGADSFVGQMKEWNGGLDWLYFIAEWSSWELALGWGRNEGGKTRHILSVGAWGEGREEWAFWSLYVACNRVFSQALNWNSCESCGCYEVSIKLVKCLVIGFSVALAFIGLARLSRMCFALVLITLDDHLVLPSTSFRTRTFG